MSHGTFSGNPKTEWLTDLHDEDRNMLLLEDFSFTDPAGRVWPAPKGETINGASIPRPLWSTVGSPYTDDYRRASVVHDIACNTHGVSRKEADAMFFHACRAGGCSEAQARILYAGVRIGAWASRSLPKRTMAKENILFRLPLEVPTTEEQFMQSKLSDISAEMQELPPGATIEQLDDIIACHLQF
ncbi:DUF1353 domain-containing protein [Thiocystis violacea]|uniref:DUF1353 domain-containing protein n=1 Tax=Thiocystis violacea TaxID=13725 RepID=UPI001908E15E|nr:DUF1353 domain-containing protein [Thiocystis violacea]MBK1723844.1 hypothetical protein [Thiocystis violacea]